MSRSQTCITSAPTSTTSGRWLALLLTTLAGGPLLLLIISMTLLRGLALLNDGRRERAAEVVLMSKGKEYSVGARYWSLASATAASSLALVSRMSRICAVAPNKPKR